MHKVFSRSVRTVVDATSFILEWTLVPIVDPRIVAKRELEQQQCIEAFKLNELATDLSKATKIF